jgi:hypothetical protein
MAKMFYLGELMKKWKQIITAGLVVAVLLLLATTGAYLFLDDAILLGLIASRFEATTGTRISYRQDATVTRTLSPAFTFNDLVVEDQDKTFLFSSSSLLLQVSMPGLLAGKLEITRL